MSPVPELILTKQELAHCCRACSRGLHSIAGLWFVSVGLVPAASRKVLAWYSAPNHQKGKTHVNNLKAQYTKANCALRSDMPPEQSKHNTAGACPYGQWITTDW